ncbi:response regulator [Vibrio sp. 10N.261.55.A7]|uniref:response regulator n=1 Tax=Vibrio sp. 10N.261.55.A7 TaxID=1880851 RepID=UPI000C8153BA|nr:response regulator [Vibrio sp. 10N.261.55.A7]PMJ89129.1 hybrid sensor histidine kinase/response regulator [Vibrio sp. 10N.261.55.A7]
MNIEEELNETLLELKRSQQREARLALENRAILDSISAITGSKNKHEIFHELKRTLALYIDFDDFVVLSKTPNETSFKTFLTSNSAFVNLMWPQDSKFLRVLNGDCIILFAPNELSEFSNLSSFVKDQINSALVTGINAATSQSVVMLLGGRKGQFSMSTRDTLSRFRPLLERALIDIEQKESLTELVAIRTNELKLAREKAEQASQAKTQFLAMMSHELRTPLNSVLGFIEILEDDLIKKEQLKMLSKMESSAEHLLVLIDDILDLTKIESGKFSIQNQWFNLKDCLFQATEQYFEDASQRHISFTRDFTALDSNLYWLDPIRLTQIVFNLLGNAIKFTHTGGVKISACVRNDALSIFISDTGVGIDSSRLSLLFTPFKQADSSITRKYGGSGLGLAITKRLVDFMGGDISVKSELAVGTSFKISFPVSQKSQETEARLRESELEPRAIRPANVLVVEDTLTNQMVIKLMLEKVGYSVTTLSNGQDAVEHLKTRNTDYGAVIMDLSMPVMDGLTATKLIRKFNKELPVIALTAHAMEKDRQDCLHAGMNVFVTKPIRREQILNALESVVTKNS